MLLTAKDSSKIKGLDFCKNQSASAQDVTARIFKRQVENKYWNSSRKIIKLSQWPSLVQYSLVIFLCCPNTIHQTETNTRNIFDENVDPSRIDDNQPIELRSPNGVERFLKMSKASKQEEGKYKFKVSPTMIKFSSSTNNHIDRKIIASAPGSESLFRNKESPSTSLTAVNFSDIRYKSSKQMAPAYELWPDTSENKRYVLNPEKFPHNNNYVYSNTNSRIPKFHQDGQSIKSYSPKLHVNLNLKSLRGVLPKPLPVMTSASSNRAIRERSAPVESEDEPLSDKREEEFDLAADKKVNEKADKTNLDQNNSESDWNNLDKLNDDGGADSDGIFTQNPNHRQINFQILDSQQALKRVQRRRLKESQVYPPGDPSRLYADALLVYVKDFNRYIKS